MLVFEVTDHIKLYIKAEDGLEDVVGKNLDKILSEVLADEYCESEIEGYKKEWNY